MINKRMGIVIAAVVVVLAASATAFALVTNSSSNCHERTVASATATHGNDSLTVNGDIPSGAVAAGGGQRIEVDGHQARLKGPGQLSVVCE